jgi:hypothetical protein
MSGPVWWTDDPYAAVAAAKVGVVYGGTWERLRAQVEAQLPKPTVEEPTEFGSIVQARWCEAPSHLPPLPWIYTPWQGEHRWRSADGLTTVWSELRDVEVLRVGIGEPS